MTTDRNRADSSAKATTNEAVGYLCPTQPIAEHAFSWTQINCWTQPLYTTPPATIPVADVQAFVETLHRKGEACAVSAMSWVGAEARKYHEGKAEAYEAAADNLAALIPRNPE